MATPSMEFSSCGALKLNTCGSAQLSGVNVMLDDPSIVMPAGLVANSTVTVMSPSGCPDSRTGRSALAPSGMLRLAESSTTEMTPGPGSPVGSGSGCGSVDGSWSVPPGSVVVVPGSSFMPTRSSNIREHAGSTSRPAIRTIVALRNTCNIVFASPRRKRSGTGVGKPHRSASALRAGLFALR